jgi:hypothetical protein
MIRQWLQAYKVHKACKTLQRITDQRKRSFETQDFARRREAGRKGTPRTSRRALG